MGSMLDRAFGRLGIYSDLHIFTTIFYYHLVLHIETTIFLFRGSPQSIPDRLS